MQNQTKIELHPSIERYICSSSMDRISSEDMDGVVNRIAVGDAVEVLAALKDNSVDLVHTSPPYNIDKPYDSSVSDMSSVADYSKFLERSITQLKRVVRPGGSIFWQTGYTQNQGETREIIPIDILSYDLFLQGSDPFMLWDRIIWRYWGGHAFTKKFTNKHETIMWYVKPGAEPVFSVDTVRERAKEYDKRNNFWGRNPGNVWEVDRVAFGAAEQTSHIAVFPEEISERIVRACSKPGDVVIDPFSGSGTLPKVAQGLGRRWLGIEISTVYAEEAAIRIGYQQPSEEDSLASELIKFVGFESQTGKALISRLQQKLIRWAKKVPIDQLNEQFQRDIDSVFHDGNGRNPVKRDVWLKYDSLLEKKEPWSDAVQIADQMLLKCYRLRRQFNGVSRYKSALLALSNVVRHILSAGSDTAYVQRVVAQEPSSFRLTEGSVELLSPVRRVVLDDMDRSGDSSGLRLNRDRNVVQGEIFS